VASYVVRRSTYPHMVRRSVLLEALLPTLAAALTPGRVPSPRSSPGTRRAVLETAAAASATLLPVVAAPTRAAAVESDSNEIGFSGALRSDIGPSVLGSGVEILITEQSYTELSACPKEFFVPTKEGPWRCLEISVTATNNGKRKQTSAIDVFGIMKDKEGFSILSTSLSSDVKGSPVASVEVNIPKGEKRRLTFFAAVQDRSPRPFTFAAWKGAYRNAGIAKTFKTFDPCEIDSSKCAEDEDQPENFGQGLIGKGNNYSSSSAIAPKKI